MTKWRQLTYHSKRNFIEARKGNSASLKITSRHLSSQRHTIWCPSIRWSSSRWKIYSLKSLVQKSIETVSANKMLSILSRGALFWGMLTSTTRLIWYIWDCVISIPTSLWMLINENKQDKCIWLFHTGLSKLGCRNPCNLWRKPTLKKSSSCLRNSSRRRKIGNRKRRLSSLKNNNWSSCRLNTSSSRRWLNPWRRKRGNLVKTFNPLYSLTLLAPSKIRRAYPPYSRRRKHSNNLSNNSKKKTKA